MGVDFSHCTASWSYSGFARFRARLAAEIGVFIDAMEGFCGLPPLRERPWVPISWTNVNDAIVPLLDHSDCDGVLTPGECEAVAPRLRELVSRWDEHDYDKATALKLASGMEEAARRGEPLEFH